MGALGSRTFWRNQYTKPLSGSGGCLPQEQPAGQTGPRHSEGPRAGADESGRPKLGVQGARTLFSSHLGPLTSTGEDNEAQDTV